MRLSAVILLLCPYLSACDNSCQRICSRMARYAERCGYEVSAADISDCKSEQRSPESGELRRVCRDYNARSTIESEFSCDDVAYYWGL